MRRPNARAPSSNSESGDMIMVDAVPRVPLRPNSTRSTNSLFSRSHHPKQVGPRSNSSLFVLATVAFSVAVICYVLLLVISRSSSSSNSGKRRFSIVIDGGSTGTRIHIFRYEVGTRPAFDFGNDASMRVNPGLSAYAEDPEGAARSLVELLDFARSKVPKLLWGDTEIRLMATAGLRMLELPVQDRILDSCRTLLRSSGFKFRDYWASVISGSDEGIYAWVVANYALGTLGGHPLQTTGIIELGGASAQVTFVSTEPLPPEDLHTLRYGNITYSLYSHSFLHFGQNVAFECLRESLIKRELKSTTESLREVVLVDPCTPRGYLQDSEAWKFSHDFLDEKKPEFTLHARGNFSECRSFSLMLLQKGKERCSHQQCLGSTFMPKLQGKFLATENFFYTSKFFGLTSTASLLDLMMAGQRFCEEDWSDLKRKYHSVDEEDLLQYCFSSAYIIALLHDGLGIALDDKRVGFANQVDNIPLDWAFGAFILQSMAEFQQPGWIGTIINDDSPKLLLLVFVCVLLMFTAWSILKWKRPQLKTIYDLEKGRYIVTRVNRS